MPNTWQNGGLKAVVQMDLSNAGTAAMPAPYMLSITGPDYLQLEQWWNWKPTQTAGPTFKGDTLAQACHALGMTYMSHGPKVLHLLMLHWKAVDDVLPHQATATYPMTWN